MRLVDIVADHRDELIRRWLDRVRTRLDLQHPDTPALRDDLPLLLDRIVDCLRGRTPERQLDEPAKAHGRQRLELGIDISELTHEFSLVTETLLELAEELGVELRAGPLIEVVRLVGLAAAQSVTEYVALRDRQLADEAASHFSFIAHELRGPLQTARLAAHLLSAEEGSPSQNLERIERAHAQLAQRIDNAITDARLKQEPRPTFEAVELGELVDEVREDAVLLAAQRDIEVRASVEGGRIDGDRKLLISLVSNLLTNAIKFSRPGGKVFLEVKQRDPVVVLEVCDECGGLPAGTADRLFNAFVQSGRDRSGFGLGLLIVEQAVRVHGGRIEVEDRHESGCLFRIKLPQRQPEGS